MMNKNISFLFSSLLLTSFAANAEIQFSGYTRATNNFMYRGLSLSDNSAAAQGQFSAKHDSGFYATLWGSSTKLRADDGSGSGLEGNFLAGFIGKITDDLTYDIGFLRTFYPGMNSGSRGGATRDFNDFYGTLNYKGFSGGFSYSDDFFAETGSAMYTFASYNAPVIQDISFQALVGHTYNSSRDFLGIFGVDENSWTHYILGLSKPLPNNFEVSGAYHWTDSNGTDAFDISGFGTNRFVVNLTRYF